MCRTKDEISMNDPLVQEIDAHIAENNLSATEVLSLRLGKHSYILGTQMKEDVEEMKRNPSLIWLLRYKTLTNISPVT